MMTHDIFDELDPDYNPWPVFVPPTPENYLYRFREYIEFEKYIKSTSLAYMEAKDYKRYRGGVAEFKFREELKWHLEEMDFNNNSISFTYRWEDYWRNELDAYDEWSFAIPYESFTAGEAGIILKAAEDNEQEHKRELARLEAERKQKEEKRILLEKERQARLEEEEKAEYLRLKQKFEGNFQ